MDINLFVQELNKVSDLVWTYTIPNSSSTYNILYDLKSFNNVNNFDYSIRLEFNSYEKGETHYKFIESYYININGKNINIYSKVNNVNSDSIFISKNKSYYVIAKELNKRLIIDYIPKLNKYVEDYLEQQNKKNKRISILKSLCNKGNLDISKHKDNDDKYYFYNKPIQEIKINYNATEIDLTLAGLTVENAEKIIEFINSLKIK